MSNNEFGIRITELRKQKGLSQKELGDLLGVSNKAVSKWENGESMPKTTTMIKLAELFEIDANELVGLKSDAPSEKALPILNEELDKLKSENAILTTKLNNIDKRRKRIFIAVLFVCIVGIVASAIIAVCFTSNNKINNDIKDAGSSKTKIVFSDITFIPADNIQLLFIKNSDDDYYDNYSLYNYSGYKEKYADYYDSNGNKQRALICADWKDSYIILKVGKKNYYYFNEKLSGKDLVSEENIYSITFKNVRVNDYMIDDNIYYQESDAKVIKAFCDFYNNKGKPVDKKITELYIDRSKWSFYVDFHDKIYEQYKTAYVEFGKFFKDNDGNIYFLDYSTNDAYKVGKELSNYVH